MIPSFSVLSNYAFSFGIRFSEGTCTGLASGGFQVYFTLEKTNFTIKILGIMRVRSLNTSPVFFPSSKCSSQLAFRGV